MSEERGIPIADPEFAEKVFLVGGVLVVAVLSVYRVVNPDDHAAAWFNLKACLGGVLFGMLNFRSWKLLVGLLTTLQRGDDSATTLSSRAKEIVFAVTFKGGIILILVLFLLRGNRDHIVSLIMAFTAYLITGAVLLALVYLFSAGWRTVSGADHELLQLAELSKEAAPESD